MIGVEHKVRAMGRELPLLASGGGAHLVRLAAPALEELSLPIQRRRLVRERYPEDEAQPVSSEEDADVCQEMQARVGTRRAETRYGPDGEAQSDPEPALSMKPYSHAVAAKTTCGATLASMLCTVSNSTVDKSHGDVVGETGLQVVDWQPSRSCDEVDRDYDVQYVMFPFWKVRVPRTKGGRRQRFVPCT